ncbi:unnamed protein product [Bursaphelenchus okinawaensis]|uniref:G-protein coupled receptors family 1 profile domain-containing protein n=1 Tax=Bursaphelenchus okinawaensis TaxID=465554 RepID=A0A811LQS6_9BILA|nr:unnamed protein product [Bursaphelenchus okinawaensis]CAG9126626.1 unnamed protein product [Bursaphelenchus okinawaensis]
MFPLAGIGLNIYVLIKLRKIANMNSFRFETSSALPLCAMSICDSICLLALFSQAMFHVGIRALAREHSSLGASLFCKVDMYLLHTTSAFSVWCWLILSILRYTAVFHPFRYRTIWRQPRDALTICAIVIALYETWILYTVQYQDKTQSCSEDKQTSATQTAHMMDIFLSYVIPAFIRIVFDGTVLCHCYRPNMIEVPVLQRRYGISAPSGVPPVTDPNQPLNMSLALTLSKQNSYKNQSQPLQKKASMIKRSLIISVVNLCCNLPSHILRAILTVDDTQKTIPDRWMMLFEGVSQLLYFGQFTCNAFYLSTTIYETSTVPTRPCHMLTKQQSNSSTITTTNIHRHNYFAEVASQRTPNDTATVGVFIDAGSRFENAENNGVAHFLEHLAFKGTAKRSQTNLELEVETYGAHLNAYTSREHTVYYAKCFVQDLERAVELLSDILLHSVYSKYHVENEKQVIIRESEEIDQIMQEVVFDRLHLGAFDGCSMARPILGSIENIKKMTREDLVNYVNTYYKGPKMVLAAAGGVDHDNLVDLASKYFGGVQKGDENVLNYEKAVFKESYEIYEKKDMELCYGVLAVEGVSWTHPLGLAFQVVNGLTGSFDRTRGSGLTMPTPLAIRMEKEKTVESFLSFITNYKDTGLTGIYFSTDPGGLRPMIKAICEEWNYFLSNIDEASVNYAKNMLYNNMIVVLDGTTPICEDIGRQLLSYDRQISIPELKARIDAIDVHTIRKLMTDFYFNRSVALNVIGPTAGCPSLKEIKQWLSV